MEFSEKKIEDLIVNSIKNGGLKDLSKRGLYHLEKYDKFFRQFNLGDYGILDLAGIKYDVRQQVLGGYKIFDIAVVEIKKWEVNSNTLFQALRYCKGIDVLLEKYKLVANYEIFLIGSTVCKGDFIYTPDYMTNLHIHTINLDLEKGITFKSECEYTLTESRPTLVSEVTIADVKSYMVNQIKDYIHSPDLF